MKKHIPISKQSYLMAIRCIKGLYLKIHNPSVAGKKQNSSAMLAGLEFEKTAMQLIAPRGIDITEGSDRLNFDSYISRTKEELTKKKVTLYQATFLSKDKERIMADVVRKKDRKIELIEIKAVTILQDIHYYDAAYQLYCITNSGYKVDKVFIAHVNKEYVRGQELTQDLVALVDVTAKVKQIQKKIKIRVAQYQEMLKQKDCPEVQIGFHCTEPYECPYKENCWGEVLPKDNIMDIRGFRMKEKMNLFYRGIHSFKRVREENIRLSTPQMIQVQCALNNEEILEKEKIREWLKQFEKAKALFFFDFETVSFATPQYEGSSPYEAIPIQFSVHHQNQINGELSHYEFLANPISKNDQRKLITEKLVEVLGSTDTVSPILAFNKRFESGRLNYLANAYPEYRKQLQGIINRLYDLADVFRNKWHYHPDFKGSYSLKYILPVLCPKLSYKGLEVQNGDQASAEYLKLSSLDKEEALKSRTAMLEYCKLDTLALVRIYEALQTRVKK